MSNLRIGVAGLTHLGLVTAAALAAKGVAVIAFDTDVDLIERIGSGDLPVKEPGLAKLLTESKTLNFTANSVALGRCDLVYIAPDVPTDTTGSADLTIVEKLLEHVVPVMGKGAVVVLLSQLTPGFTRAHAPPGRAVYCQVETLIFGDAVARALKPERIIVGTEDPGAPLADSYKSLLAIFDCPVLVMGYESAELAKIAINVQLSASLTAANSLAAICESIGADWREILPALKLDSRIGPHAYLDPGLGIGGGNLERDLKATAKLAAEAGTDNGLIHAILENSRQRRDWVLRRLADTVLGKGGDPVIAILGLAYKAGTDSTRNSPGLSLIESLRPYALRVFDPEAVLPAINHDRLTVVDDPMEAISGANALAIMTPWEAFKDLAPHEITARLDGRVVIDPWGVLDSLACIQAGLDYSRLGVSPTAKLSIAGTAKERSSKNA